MLLILFFYQSNFNNGSVYKKEQNEIGKKKILSLILERNEERITRKRGEGKENQQRVNIIFFTFFHSD